VLAILTLGSLLGAAAVADPGGDAAPDTALAATVAPPADAVEIRDPLFAFFIALAEADSLGVWGVEDLHRFMAEIGRESKLPFDHLVRVVRREAAGPEIQKRRGRKITRVWEVALDDDLKMPMPYSILGYHPGSLLLSREIVLSEWELGDPNFHVASDGEVTIFPSTSLLAFRLDAGHVILDVDGWLDRLLGGKLDDAWTRGFAICRVEGKLYGVAVGADRDGENDYGEFDFAEDKVLPHGRPVARGMNFYVRPWLQPPDGAEDRIWQFEPD
jgi:hypothetical protein